MPTIFEHTVNGLTAFVTGSGDSYSVGMRNAAGEALPYSLSGLRLEQAKERAARFGKLCSDHPEAISPPDR
jgi:hypothetical protein